MTAQDFLFRELEQMDMHINQLRPDLETLVRVMELYGKEKWEQGCAAQKSACVSAIPYPIKSYNKTHRLITEAVQPEFQL